MIANSFAPALLEDWLRQYYFSVQFDLGCSGVESFSFAELRALTGITSTDLDQLVFKDSHTFGADGIRQAIARRWGDGNFAGTMVTHGSSEAIFLIMNAVLRPDDEVIVTSPVYHQLAAVPKSLGCRLKYWHLLPEENFEPKLERLQALVTPKTKMVVLNFPHNPTGATVSETQMREIVSMASRVGAYLFWDNAFRDLTYSEPPLSNPCLLYERAISVSTLSKAYGLPGLRVGWCMAQPEVIEKCVTLRDNLTLHLSPLVEFIAQRAIEHGDALVGDRLAMAKRNLHVLEAWARKESDDIGWVPPRAGVSAFVEIKRQKNVEEFCKRVAEEASVLLVPGQCFDCPQHVRLGFGCSEEVLAEGLRRLSAHLRQINSTVLENKYEHSRRTSR